MRAKLATLTALALSSAALFGADMDEKQFQKLMKEVGDTTKHFKGYIDSKDSDQLSKDASRVSDIYKQMADFWEKRKTSDAAKWSHESSNAAAKMVTAAKAQNWDEVKASAQAYMKNCKACHEVHREKLDDGSSKIK